MPPFFIQDIIINHLPNKCIIASLLTARRTGNCRQLHWCRHQGVLHWPECWDERDEPVVWRPEVSCGSGTYLCHSEVWPCPLLSFWWNWSGKNVWEYYQAHFFSFSSHWYKVVFSSWLSGNIFQYFTLTSTGTWCSTQKSSCGHDPRTQQGCAVHHHNFQTRAAWACQQILWCEVQEQSVSRGVCFKRRGIRLCGRWSDTWLKRGSFSIKPSGEWAVRWKACYTKTLILHIPSELDLFFKKNFLCLRGSRETF